MEDYNSLIKILKNDSGNLTLLKVAIVAEFSTQHLAKAIKAAGILVNLKLEVWEADYDSVEQTIVDENSNLYASQFDFILIFPSVFKLYKHYSWSSKDKLADEQRNKW